MELIDHTKVKWSEIAYKKIVRKSNIRLEGFFKRTLTQATE